VNSDRNCIVRGWLLAKDDSRAKAIQQASAMLLDDYLRHWSERIPVDLKKLANSLATEIVEMDEMKGDGFLMPTQNGFRILVRPGQPIGRHRATIAHELAHILFYSDPKKGQPRRLIPTTLKEEHFCFDLARHILAPRAHLKAIGIIDETDPIIIFSKLVEQLKLSRPWAARIMFADYGLAKGIGGRWVQSSLGWKQERGSASATPSLSVKTSLCLRGRAVTY
jgi:hypothetical protein